MDLNNEMQILVSKIKAPSIFYIPRQLLNGVSEKDMKYVDKVGLLDTMFIINKEGVNKRITHANELLYLLDKQAILSSNTFQLLLFKSKLDKDTFHYLLVEYLKELKSWLRVLEMVGINAKLDLDYYKPYFQSYLDMQFNDLTNHQKELNEKFGHWKTEFEIGRIFNILNFKLVKNRSSFNKIDGKEKKNHKKSEEQPKSIKRKNKPLLIDEDDADRHLLKTVFNVNLNKIKVVKRKK